MYKRKGIRKGLGWIFSKKGNFEEYYETRYSVNIVRFLSYKLTGLNSTLKEITRRGHSKFGQLKNGTSLFYKLNYINTFV